jgi:glycosyltransferase involved in cell wall biosynthesis
MTPLELILMILLVINFSILLLVLWNAVRWPKPGEARKRHIRSCSVLIPARDERDNIASCLEAVLRQGEPVLEIIVCDDHSTDQTASIVKRLERTDPRIRLVAGPALPSGWCGKTFACATLAGEAAGEWLLFLDADARLCEGAIERMLQEAAARNVSFLSCWPGLELKGFWEKTLMPMLNFVVLTLFPAPLSLKRQDASLGLAHGACILARREEYNKIGGHEAVHNEIFEDTSLARIWRAGGERGICLDGQSIVRVRMYDSFHGIWNGFRKNFFPSFHHAFSFWLFLLLHLFSFFLPFVLFVVLAIQNVWSLPVGLAAMSVFLMRASLALRFGHPLWSVFLHPLAESILLILGITSWRSCRGGRGVSWKGRTYRSGSGASRGSGI